MNYRQVFIKSEEDLPKIECFYFVQYKGGNITTAHWHRNNEAWLFFYDWYLEPIPEAKSAEEIDLIEHVTNLLYYAHVEAMDMHSIDFDKWVDENTTNLKEYASQFSQPKELPNKPGYPQEFVLFCINKVCYNSREEVFEISFGDDLITCYTMFELYSYWLNEINK